MDAAAPEVFYDTPNSRWVMNYSGFDGTTWRMGLAYSTDLLSWTDEATNPVFEPAGAEGYIAANGTILYKSGTYYHFYNGFPSSVWAMYLATSPDLLTWTRQNSGNPVLSGTGGTYDAGGIADPQVRLLEDASFECFYTAPENATTYRIGRATSADGITWSKQGTLDHMSPYAATANLPNNQFAEGTSASVYRLYFCRQMNTDLRKIYVSNTVDGSTFHYSGLLLDKGAGWESAQVFDPATVIHNGTIYMFYAGSTLAGGGENLDAQIGVATASNI